MKRFRFNQKFIFGLYAYLRQLELSIHRRESVEELKKYLIRKIFIEEVIEYIDKTTGVTIDSELQSIPSTQIFPRYLKGLVLRISRCSNSLSKKEISHLKYLLSEAISFLEYDNNLTYDPATLRYDLRVFYESVLKQKITRAQIQKANKIEHYNQSDWHEHFELEEIIQASWPS